MGHTENKILLAKVWQKLNTYQLNCGNQTLAWQSVLGTKQALGFLYKNYYSLRSIKLFANIYIYVCRHFSVRYIRISEE
jgi:hypothetical protein